LNYPVFKIWKRFSITALYGAGQSVNTFVRLFSSVLVFQLKSPELWGEFVKVSIIVQLLSFVTGWGQRDYLIKNFSKSPKGIYLNWGNSVYSRLPILFLVLTVIFFLPFPLSTKIIMCLWLIGHYFGSSFQVIILFLRKFKFSFWCELLTGIILPLLIFIYASNLSVLVILSGVVIGLLFKMALYAFYFREFLLSKYFGFDQRHIIKGFPFFLPSVLGLVQSRIDTYFVAIYLEEQVLAYYNIFISLLNFSYNVINFIITPFSKNIYRISLPSLKKLQYNVVLISSLFAIFSMLVSKSILPYYYGYSLPNLFFIIGTLNIVAFSTYVLIINKLFRFNLQKLVSIVPLVILILQIPISIYLIPIYSIQGALIINFGGQIFTIASFIYLELKFNTKTEKHV
jgi:O-antigen/teichoic acid export membrane protein